MASFLTLPNLPSISETTLAAPTSLTGFGLGIPSLFPASQSSSSDSGSMLGDAASGVADAVTGGTFSSLSGFFKGSTVSNIVVLIIGVILIGLGLFTFAFGAIDFGGVAKEGIRSAAKGALLA